MRALLNSLPNSAFNKKPETRFPTEDCQNKTALQMQRGFIYKFIVLISPLSKK
jgi:hypothetical protein